MRKSRVMIFVSSMVMCLLFITSGVIAFATDFSVVADTSNQYNLLSNGSVEDEIKSGADLDWEIQYGAKVYEKTTEKDPKVRSGNKSIRIDATNSTLKPFARNLELIPNMSLPIISFGAMYQLSFWAKATDGFRGYQFLRVYYNTDQNVEGALIPNIEGYGKPHFANNESNIENVWEKVVYTFIIPKEFGKTNIPVTKLRFVIFEGQCVAAGNLFYDDFSFIKINTELKTGEIDEQKVDLISAFTLSEELTDANVAKKVKAKCEGADSNDNLYAVIDKSKLANDIYMFSFRIKAENVYRTSNSYPNGISPLPTIMKNNDINGFSEVMDYKGISIRNYVQGYLKGFTTADGKVTEAIGCLPIPVGEANKTNIGWTTIKIPFNAHALPNGTTSGTDIVNSSDVTQMALVIKLCGVSGTISFDDIKIYRQGTPEPNYATTQVPLTVVVADNTEKKVAYGVSYLFSEAIAKVDVDGVETVVTNDILLTVQHLTNEVWTDESGCINMTYNAENRAFVPNNHGYFRMVYSITKQGRTLNAYATIAVQDTLIGVTLDTNKVKKLYATGDELDLTGLLVQKNMSYSGKSTIADTDYTVNNGGYTAASGEGVYTITISISAAYGGTKTATFEISVEDVIPLVLIVEGKTKFPISYGVPVVFPEAKASGKVDGVDTDLSSTIKLTVQHLTNEIWTNEKGYVDMPYTLTNRTFTTNQHGYWRMVYVATNMGTTLTVYAEADVQDTLESITVDSSNVKKNYKYGETLNFDGLRVTQTMSYSGEKDLPKAEGETKGYTIDLGGYTNESAPGTYTISIRYTSEFGGSKTATYQILVKDYATAITVDTQPTKKQYKYGETFDKTGMTASVMLVYGGKTEIPVAEIVVAGFIGNKIGTQSLKIVYGEMESSSFDITVVDEVSSIAVDIVDMKTVYQVGDTINLDGLKVTKIMKSGVRVDLEVADYTVSYGDYTVSSSVGEYELTVMYTLDGVTKTAGFTIDVTAKDKVPEKTGCNKNNVVELLVVLMGMLGLLAIKHK